ncbi:bifunctional DNA-formamidopyrimidine glycosylase/DNA-(apurinic or apyrimidinic site) lyase [Sporosarcina sp. Marseille-Q4063]|uniref:bifunctional DNA-formamidopyrimidine glycosylase/DNA-(apurinic or apyrimidinic site) lyase n=1 Tax=Sporosarcina sp. Marseille-Q4063 TaxID=2810514 RepID=UPI001BAE7509|nr:bifunctional DNA-formamidopyrimidine glycosylase/DNA-(apurinic or apyrimidinic site) lyase [Sporosarcina sp. Marseille-Q4063]QUW22688.1 bifunctional DNA-formamidopyrimidine glycosylase/DNA-(apurinic or apyrimidinic site) lyase [Sporosarcina sp. Marseille-Q4063]
MPELPEVEGVVRAFAPEAIGRTIKDVTVSDVVIESKKQGREAIIKGMSTDDFIQQMKQMSIVNVTRRSKYIYMDLQKGNNDYLLVSHLGMSGAWFVVNSIDEISELKFRRHIHVIFTMEDGGLLVYSDIRRFGELRLLNVEADHPPLLKMAPEPFDGLACSHFLDLARLPKYAEKPIKEVIMDGQVISGCGNIYATEALFKMNIHPTRKARRISLKRKTELFYVIVKILQESIDAGGSTISDYRNINGESGDMQNRLKMYGRKVCLNCETDTKSVRIAGRTSVYCPKCQR